ncbi:MAG: hypothetical protein HYR83_01780 [Planctomycetes bacterium]|nr:hypothetical protein [Planctomycetota bacterium]
MSLRKPNTRLGLALAFSFSMYSAPASDQQPQPPVPIINAVQRQYLSHLIRRTVRDAKLKRPEYVPDFVPEALTRLNAEVVVRLRRDGYLIGLGVGQPGPIPKSAQSAAQASVAMLSSDGFDADDLANLLIEVEVLGETQDLPANLNWLNREELRKYIEPGIHGLVFLTPSGVRRVCPSDFYTGEISLDDGLKTLAQSLHQEPSQAPDTRLRRFRSVHWYERSSGAPIVSLNRGMLPASGSPSRSSLSEGISNLASYIEYRQRATGLFAYEFDAGEDRYADDDNLVRQIGITASLSQYAALSGKSPAAADAAIRYHLRGLRDLSVAEDSQSGTRPGFIAMADASNKLGVTALLALALVEHPRSNEFAEAREKLIRGILWLQQPSGMFVSAFPPAEQLGGQDFFPGEALVALAADYERQPEERILKAFDAAMAFYGEYFRLRQSPAFTAWQVQAFAHMAMTTNRGDFAAFAFEQADWLVGQQLDPSNCTWPDLFGGIGSDDGPSAASGLYLEALTDALSLARKRNDAARITRYETAVRGMAELVLRLQVKPEEAYFARSRKDVIGGIRSAPASTRIRIDHCGHALVGLSKALHVLFPKDG